MNRERLSRDEKLKRLLDLLHEKDTLFTLPELEKAAQKEKGIVANTVKEILEELVLEGLVKEEKIGVPKYYWAFRSDAHVAAKAALQKAQAENKELEKREKDLRAQIEAMTRERSADPARTEKLATHATLEQQLLQTEATLEVYRANDPAEIKRIAEQTAAAKRSANRWTENIFIIVAHLSKKYGIERTALYKSFSIPDDLDTL